MKIKILQEGKALMPSDNVGLSVDDDEVLKEGAFLAQMLENRAFENADLAAFSVFPEGGGAELKLSSDRPLFPETPHYLRLSALSGGKGFKNDAFGGITLNAKEKYEFSFYARSYDFKGFVEVKIVREGQCFFEKKFFIKPDGKWHKFICRKKALKSVKNANFLLLLSAPGTLHIDWLSMVPLNAIKGIFRRDVFEILRDFKPGFLRFTGGTELKDTLSLPERRQFCPTKAGFYELLLYCEALRCKPLPVISFSGKNAESEIGDFLDLVEFALGSIDTEWGSVRGELGHAAPFALEYLMLSPKEGGEEFLDKFAERLHEKFPKLKLIAPEALPHEKYDHFYGREEVLFRSPDWFFENAHRYDGEPRGRRLVVSFAATERGALAEAAFMTGLEQNADLVCAACRLSLTGERRYPSLDPLILFDGEEAKELPGLSVQKLFNQYTGNTLLKTVVEGAEGVYASATEREGFTFVKIVNSSDLDLTVEIEGETAPGELNRIVLMQEDPVDSSVVPCEVAPSSAKSLSLPPRSFSVVVLRR